MSAKPENTFIASVHKHLPPDLYRMKNHNVYNAGIPDVWYSGMRGDLWVEYKFIVVPKRETTIVKIDLSALQKEWLRSRFKEGRNVAVVVGHKDGGVWFNHPDQWEKDLTTLDFVEQSTTRALLAHRIKHWVGP